MKPITENITQPANTDVRQHVTADMMESLQSLRISINYFKIFEKRDFVNSPKSMGIELSGISQTLVFLTG